jgi:hypothetical protein
MGLRNSGQVDEKIAWQDCSRLSPIQSHADGSSRGEVARSEATLDSRMAAPGVSPIIGKALGHRSLSATAIYARVNLDAVREGLTRATDAMRSRPRGEPLLGDGQ